ncbi:MAG TPA: hypothetical protein VFA15_08520, partial [Nitrososphaera sp.]|nr:hypothetical protein [Nitrososphaera sp.]
MNFSRLAALLSSLEAGDPRLASLDQFIWAQAMRLVQEHELTPLARLVMFHDPGLSTPLARGVGYVELVANEEAEAITSISRRLFSHFSWFHDGAFTLQKVLAFFIAEGVGVNEDFSISPFLEQERRREAHRFLRSLCADEAFA